MIRLLAAALIASCALAAPSAHAAGDDSPAVKTFRADAKPILSTLAAALRDAERGLAADLDAATAGPISDPEAFLGVLLAAYDEAFEAATGAQLTALSAADEAGTLALQGAAATATPGLTVGAGGALDEFHVRVAREMTRFDASVRKATGKALKKARKTLGEGAVLTAATFAVPTFGDADPGQVSPTDETGFMPRTPLVLMGYGDATATFVLILSTGYGPDDHVFNVYDGDGSLFVEARDLPALPTEVPYPRMLGVVTDLTGGPPTPHGNLRIEAFLNGADGWTRSIGY
jgi:hypothetical protein